MIFFSCVPSSQRNWVVIGPSLASEANGMDSSLRSSSQRMLFCSWSLCLHALVHTISWGKWECWEIFTVSDSLETEVWSGICSTQISSNIQLPWVLIGWQDRFLLMRYSQSEDRILATPTLCFAHNLKLQGNLRWADLESLKHNGFLKKSRQVLADWCLMLLAMIMIWKITYPYLSDRKCLDGKVIILSHLFRRGGPGSFCSSLPGSPNRMGSRSISNCCDKLCVLCHLGKFACRLLLFLFKISWHISLALWRQRPIEDLKDQDEKGRALGVTRARLHRTKRVVSAHSY